jgi:chemotaxis-related protein WspD
MLDQMNTDTSDGIVTCWKTIGVRGDSSCPELQTYSRCLNCPTYSSTAMSMLDRIAVDEDVIANWGVAARHHAYQEKTESALIFRVGVEWLALPPQVINEVAPQNTIHTLPHQTNRAILGLTNIRGALVLCVSLSHMLNADNDAQVQNSPRLLVVSHQGQKLVFPVDEVYGIHRYNLTELQDAPTTLAHANNSYTQALITWNKHKVGLLDCDLLCFALNRSLT